MAYRPHNLLRASQGGGLGDFATHPGWSKRRPAISGRGLTDRGHDEIRHGAPQNVNLLSKDAREFRCKISPGGDRALVFGFRGTVVAGLSVVWGLFGQRP
jgi:hypothetical protein